MVGGDKGVVFVVWGGLRRCVLVDNTVMCFVLRSWVACVRLLLSRSGCW
jgi:hypothetical protein